MFIVFLNLLQQFHILISNSSIIFLIKLIHAVYTQILVFLRGSELEEKVSKRLID